MSAPMSEERLAELQGRFRFHKSLSKEDCADLLAEVDRLRKIAAAARDATGERGPGNVTAWIHDKYALKAGMALAGIVGYVLLGWWPLALFEAFWVGWNLRAWGESGQET